MLAPANWTFAWRKEFRVALVFSALAALSWLCWKATRDPAIPLLPPGGAAWIVYPSPPHAEINSVRPVPAEFARQWILGAAPSRAELEWRAFRQSEIFINGVVLPKTGQGSANWKNVTRVNALSYLRPGTNTISVTVWNDNGPPALSLRLEIDGAAVNTDPDWGVSAAGSVWRPARLASANVEFGAGNELNGLEETGPALRQCWPRLCIFLLVATVVAAGLEFGPWNSGAGSRWWRFLACGAAAAWLALFLHNARLLPHEIGFDASSHLEYISYIQERHSLPAPTQGWEMFQAPLYYAVSAALLAVGHLKASQSGGILLLHALSVLIGAVNVALIFSSLRLLFPGQWKNQLVGGLLAAFLPAQICLLHYTTNETLSATLISAAFYLCLRILRAPLPAIGLYVALGCVLGLALLAKVSAIVFIPAIFVVLAGRLILDRQSDWLAWVRTVGLAGFVALAVAGWRYAALWRDFGNPLIGNWDARIAEPWWQEPGYHTMGYFFAFGHSLTTPLFSGFDSFWDCFYTTLWGDGLAGGAAAVNSLPPWNYPFMDAGFLLALVPSALVLTGASAAVARCWRKPDLEILLFVGASVSAGFAILYMSLKLAFYSQSKCFYGLPAMLPLCVFGVMGLDAWARRGRLTRVALGASLLLWLVNVYAAFWIRPNALRTQIYTAVSDVSSAADDPATRRAVEKLLRTDPANETGILLQCQLEPPAAAVERLQKALGANPNNGEFARFLAAYLNNVGQTNEAFAVAQRAFSLEPENLHAANQLCALATELGRNQEALDSGRAALAMDPSDPTLQFNVACAWANLRDPAQAIRQFETLLTFKPPADIEAKSHFYLGRLLSGEPGRKADAISHFQASLRLQPDNPPCRQALEKLRDGG